MSQKEESIRIYVGGLSKTLADTIQDLETRFSKFGHVKKPFEVHCKEIINYYYAYITLKTTEQNFKKLQKTFHGSKFKASQLIISKAKPDFKQRWAIDSRRQDTNIKQRQRRQKISDCRILRIKEGNLNPFKKSLVIRGRVRKTPRKIDLKKSTIRVNFKGTVKVIRCRKTKVWGYNKNKKLRDLVHHFAHGLWKDGNDHIIERLTKKVLVFDNTGVKVVESSEDEEQDEEENEELKKNDKILSSLFGKYNFDRPVELDDDKEEYGSSDYEFEGGADRSDAEDEVIDIDPTVAPSYDAIAAEFKKTHQIAKPYDENDDDDQDDDEEFYKNLKPEEDTDGESFVETTNAASNKENKVINDDPDHDYEFLPTFGSSKSKANENENEKKNKTSETEALRSLLNPVEESGSFKFDLDDDDIDESKNIEVAEPPVKPEPIAPVEVKKKFGL
ncbi:unnamed protein product [Ambrosiozyma monospora]|uniref:Unnamed protein product n=1 Tax=Ambrosiozyma monospora TaxID=43982 RepID=A0ACB5T248_AMBMO|nr:unnamed protein product [Ambrosiozyma monospora]